MYEIYNSSVMQKNKLISNYIHSTSIISIIIILMTGFFSYAQESIKQKNETYKKVTLAEALEMAKQNYPSIKAKEAEVKGAKQELGSTRSQYIPALFAQDQISFGSVNTVRGSFFPNEGMAIPTSGGISNDPTNMQGVFGSYSSFVMNWKFFNFGKIRANVKASKAGLSSATLDYDNEVFQHQVRVADVYLLLIVAEKLVNVEKVNFERLKTLRSAILSNTSSGLRPGVDSSYINAEYSKALMLLLESQKNETSQRLKLAELIGSSSSNIQADTMSFYNSMPQVSDEIVTIDNNPLLKYKLAQVDIMKARAIAVKRSYAPSISFLGAAGGRGSGASNNAADPVTGKFALNSSFGAGVPFKAYNYFFAVSVLWNIFDYPRIHHLYRSELYKVERDNYLYEEQKLILNRQMENVVLQINLAKEQAHQAPIQLSFARSAYNQAQARYKAGLATLPEVAQNFYLLNRSETDLSIAYSNVWRALLMKSAVVGDLTIFTSQVK